jgi:hypothetical protein
MQITGGRVSFGRSVQPAQYEGRKAEVELTFALEEGTTEAAAKAALDHVAAMAKAKALEIVKDDKATAKAAAEAPPVTPKATTEPKTAPKGKTKADLEAEQNAKLAASGGKATVAGDDLVEEKPAISTGGERKDPAQADPDGLDDGAAPAAKVYSDKDLTDTASKVNAIIKNPQAIKDVRAKYTDTPTAAIATIPQEKRAGFVADLEALLAAHKTK